MIYINELKLQQNKKIIEVQAGATWEKVQTHLDKYHLSVAEMQSYRNFSVGGSISVNCHGRGMKYGTIADTIISLLVLTSDGRIFKVSRTQNVDLFKAVVGGYGTVAIIVSATLIATDNYPIKRHVEIVNRAKYMSILNNLRIPDENLVFYNGNIYPNKEDEIVNIYWYQSDEKVTILNRIQPKKKYYWHDMCLEQLLRRFDLVKSIRAHIEPKKLRVKENCLEKLRNEL